MRWFALSLALAALPLTASAQVDPIDARFEAGRVLRRDHRDAEALAHFQQLYAETHQMRSLAQVGLAEAALGRWRDAEQHLVEAMATPDAWINSNRAAGVNLDQQMQRILSHLGVLEVLCDAPGAEVWIGDRRIATLPLTRPLRLEAGRVTFEVRASGYAPVQRATEVIAGGVARESVTLTRTLAVAEPRGAVSTGASERSVAIAPRPSSLTRTLAWVAAGGAAVFVVGGVVAYAVGAPAAERWNDDQQCLRPGQTREDVCGSDGSTARTMSAVEITGFVGGGALAALSAVLFLTSRRSPSGAAALSCGGGPGDVGVACVGRF